MQGWYKVGLWLIDQTWLFPQITGKGGHFEKLNGLVFTELKFSCHSYVVYIYMCIYIYIRTCIHIHTHIMATRKRVSEQKPRLGNYTRLYIPCKSS